MKTYLQKGLMVLCLSALVVSSAQADKCLRCPVHSSQEGYLFVQSAQHATVSSTGDDTYEVKLDNVTPYVTYFSDRPKRYASSMPMNEFLALWHDPGSDGFKGDPPNVDLHGIKDKEGKDLNLVLVLTDPIYNNDTRTLRYTAHQLSDSKANVVAKADLDDVVLFIDNVCLTCWGG